MFDMKTVSGNGIDGNAATGLFVSINNLREISDCCRDGEPLDHELADWLSRALEGYLTQQFRTLEEALGLIFPRGGIPWWREEAMRKRDAALRRLAEDFHGGRAPTSLARVIALTAKRYAATSWRLDCTIPEMPDCYRGTPKEHLWRAFKSGAPMPIGERQLRNVLAR